MCIQVPAVAQVTLGEVIARTQVSLNLVIRQPLRRTSSLPRGRTCFDLTGRSKRGLMPPSHVFRNAGQTFVEIKLGFCSNALAGSIYQPTHFGHGSGGWKPVGEILPLLVHQANVRFVSVITSNEADCASILTPARI